MAQISLERVRQLQAEIDEINRTPLHQVEIMKGGKVVEISNRMRDDMRFTGLSTFALLQQIDKQNQ
jgi:uncharacterized protein (DUF885 family)